MKRPFLTGLLMAGMLASLVGGVSDAFSEDKPIVLAKKEQVQETAYLGNPKSHIYHQSGCWLAKKLTGDEVMNFGSTDEAQSAGFRACKKCLKGQ